MRKLAFILYVAASTICCGYDDYDISGITHDENIVPTLRIAELHAKYHDTSLLVNEDIVVAGYVSATDASGNFYRTFMIEDNGYALEIKGGLYDMNAYFGMGRYVAVKLRDLYLGRYYGVLQVGVKPSSSNYETDYFPSKIILDQYVYRGDMMKTVQPQELTLTQITDQTCGSLVRIEGLTLVRDEEMQDNAAWCEDTYSYRIFKDADGNSIAVYTYPTADYAQDTIPDAQISITGILQYGKTGTTIASEMYILKPRNHEDIQ